MTNTPSNRKPIMSLMEYRHSIIEEISVVKFGTPVTTATG
jgi:hypothetical protein